MKAYVIVTGLIFGLLTVAHVMRMITERPLATDAAYISITGLTAVLCVWALFVLRRDRR